MTIIDPATLALFRGYGRCGWCRQSRHLEPHHVHTRGAGQLDLRINLIGLDRACHDAHHYEGYPSRDELVALVAQREGVLQGEIEAVIWFCRRVPNGAPAWLVKQEMKGLRGKARAMVRAIIKQQKVPA